MTQTAREIVELLRERDARWQRLCDGWIADANKQGEVSAEQERIMRETWERKAADLIGQLSTALNASEARVTPDELRQADRKAERRLNDYFAWKRQPHPVDPEDAGRELEFAWGEAWDLGYAAALTSQEEKQI